MKLKFQICISAFVLYCKRKLHTNFHKKIFIFKPPGIFWKWKLWRACAGAHRARLPKCWIWPVLSDQKKILHSTPVPTYSQRLHSHRVCVVNDYTHIAWSTTTLTSCSHGHDYTHIVSMWSMTISTHFHEYLRENKICLLHCFACSYGSQVVSLH